jgi:hypothetical protein
MRADTGAPLLLEKAFGKGPRAPVRQHLRPRLDRLPRAPGLPALDPPPGRLPRPGALAPRRLLRHGGSRPPAGLRHRGAAATGGQEARRLARPPDGHRRRRGAPGVHRHDAAGRLHPAGPGPTRRRPALRRQPGGRRVEPDVPRRRAGRRPGGGPRAAEVEARLVERFPGHAAITYVPDPAQLARVSWARGGGCRSGTSACSWPCSWRWASRGWPTASARGTMHAPGSCRGPRPPARAAGDGSRRGPSPYRRRSPPHERRPSRSPSSASRGWPTPGSGSP